MPNKLIRMALLAILVLLFQGTWALAGTTGGVSGYFLEQNGTPIAAATVTATSPSAVETAHTDNSGHFIFISLTPDTYTITGSKEGFDTASQAGITVIADNTQTLTLHTQRTAKVIAIIPVRAANELVRPGTTADVYSVNAAQSTKLANLGGGGGADNAYGAIASIPGAYVPPGQYGWYQTVHIRGGDYDQVGYEYDGVPVNRAFDNYPSSTASNVGQNEVQLYTGAAPQNAESQGLAGFINQVIKNGTYPGFGELDAAIGGPGLYNRVNLEIGGSTPNRNFTYYVATGGYNTRPRIIDNSNGAGIISRLFGAPQDTIAGGSCTTIYATNDSCVDNYAITGNFLNGVPFTAITGPAGYLLGGINMAPYTFQVADRENVVNLHFGLPHRNDSGKDDIQLLYSTSLLRNPYYTSPLDWGAALFATDSAVGAGLNGYPVYFNGYEVRGTPPGTTFATGCPPPCGVVTYQWPSSNVPAFSNVPSGLQDSSENGQGIFKLQYQHNIASTAYLRIYAYSYYSWWFLAGVNTTNSAFVGCCPGDYELFTHTRGASAQFQDQINAKNLFTAQISGVTAYVIRDNNTQQLSSISSTRRRAFVLVDAASPFSGLCYNTSGALRACMPDVSPNRATWIRMNEVQASGIPVAPTTCPSGQCTYLEAESGPYATFNHVKPTFYSGSIGDQWKPTDKLLLNLGVRLDSFIFQGSSTNRGPTSGFWFNAWNNEFCVSALPGSSPVNKYSDLRPYYIPLAGGPITANTPCASITDPTNPGHTYLNATLVNVSEPKFTYTVWQPRVGGTYTAGPDDVIRFSIGQYVQAPNSAFEQYNTLQQNTAEFIGRRFSSIGFNTPGHQVVPSVALNTDLSWEHRFANSDFSFKLTPFYRKTKDQYQQFFLDQKTSFVSGLPVGKQTSEGVEFQLSKGDFSRNGLSGILTYTYTWSYIQYQNLPGNGGNVLTSINNAIKTYNGYTSFCAANPSDARCGMPTNLMTATPCYSTLGAPAPGCATGTNANPYWKAPVQALFNPTANYIPYDIFPNGFNSSVGSYAVPHVGTLILNWKHDKFSVTPTVQYFGEGFYGAPLQTPGVDPASNDIPGSTFSQNVGGLGGGCGPALGTPIAGDPRYPYGAPAGSPYDATTCNTLINIPNPFTGRFDTLGAFRSPQQLLGALILSFESTPRVTYTASFNNLVNTCWGGSKQPWTSQPGVDHKVCGYGLPGYAPLASVGNFYNPDSTFQSIVRYPYMPSFGVGPVTAGFEVKLKL